LQAGLHINEFFFLNKIAKPSMTFYMLYGFSWFSKLIFLIVIGTNKNIKVSLGQRFEFVDFAD